MPSQTRVCIYCPSTIPPTKREHVMSQALGTFEQNWTLSCVCDECNSYFSKHLELALGRDSFEGYRRVELGVVAPEKIEKLLHRRVKFTLQDGGVFDGLRMVMKADEAGIAPAPKPQVGLRCEGQAWQYFFEHELTPQAIGGFTADTVEIKIIGNDSAGDLSRLIARLGECGLRFSETGRIMNQPFGTGPKLTVVHEFNVDTTLRRAAAKIGFNYAAKVLGCAVMMRNDFEPIRRFIRHGEEPQKLVSAQDWSPLVGESAATSNAHVCALGWEPTRSELIGLVCLFNRITYGIRLARSSTNEWAGVSRRHLFDPVRRSISELPIAS